MSAMAPELQKAVLDETFKLSAMMRQNCALKHGIAPVHGITSLGDIKPEPAPPPQPVNVTVQPTPVTVQPAPVGPTIDLSRLESLVGSLAAATKAASIPAINPPSPGEAGRVPSAGLPPWAKAAAAGLTAIGLGTGGAMLGSYMTRPATNTTTEVIEQAGSLLQSLEDRGFHLPPGGEP